MKKQSDKGAEKGHRESAQHRGGFEAAVGVYRSGFYLSPLLYKHMCFVLISLMKSELLSVMCLLWWGLIKAV